MNVSNEIEILLVGPLVEHYRPPRTGAHLTRRIPQRLSDDGTGHKQRQSQGHPSLADPTDHFGNGTPNCRQVRRGLRGRQYLLSQQRISR